MASPVTLLKKRNAEKDREIAGLKARLGRADGGSLLDLKPDDADAIGRIIVDNVSEYKVATIQKAIGEALKARRRQPAPAPAG